MSQNGDHESEEGSLKVSEDESESEEDTSQSSEEDSENEENHQSTDETAVQTHPQDPHLVDSQQRPPIPATRRRVPNQNGRRENNGADFEQRNPSGFDTRNIRDWHPRMERGNALGGRQMERSFMNYPEDSPHGFSSLQYDYQVLSPKSLIDALSTTPNFQTSLLQLVEQRNFHPAQVRRLISNFQHIFIMRNDQVVLQPQVAICNNHLGASGCRNRSNCNDIHICQKYIADQCDERGCLFGHKFHTNHNTKILDRFHVSHFTTARLKNLLRGASHIADIQGPLDICQNYNKGNCSQENCDSLHICSDYVAGNLRCSIQQCNLNHNLLSSDCRWLLDIQGIDTNEAPRDILANLLEVNPSIGKLKPTLDAFSGLDVLNQVSTEGDPSSITESIQNTRITQQHPNKDISNTDNIRSGRLSNELQSQSVSSSNNVSTRSSVTQNTPTTDTSHFNVDNTYNSTASSELVQTIADINSQASTPLPSAQAANSNSNGNLNKTPINSGIASNTQESRTHETDPLGLLRPIPNLENSRSLWAHQLEGDVRLAEICYDSVENTCPDESKGCPKLHSSRHFHWQVSEESYTWLNLQPTQVFCLERSFCNPAVDVTRLPPLNREHLDPAMQILLLLMGEETWQVNFQGMILVNSDNSRILYLRRLCTEIIPGLLIEQSVYHWFYCDLNGIWREYGDTSSDEEEQSNYVNSEAIESQYMINPNSYAQFTISGNEYILDFNAMTQTNTSDQEIKNVRRRPQPHLPIEELEEDNQPDSTPILQRYTTSSITSSEEELSD